MSLVNTLVQQFRADVPEFDKNEFRIMQAGALQTFQKQTASPTSWMTQDLIDKAKKTTSVNSVAIPVIDYKNVTIRSTRPLVITGTQNTSQLYTVTWNTYAFTLEMYAAQHYNNDINKVREFQKQLKAALVAVTAAIETTAVSTLNSARSQVANHLGLGHTFTLDTVHEFAANYKDSYILGDLIPMMNGNDFYGVNLDVVGNQGLNSLLMRQEGFGDNNDENKQWQWQMKNFAFSNQVLNSGAKKATGYAIAEDQLGLLTRVEPDAELGTKLKNGTEWGKQVLPGLNLEFGTYEYDNRVDASGLSAATAHLTRTGVSYVDFAIDIAFLTPYNSDPATIPAPILKFDFNLTGGS
jgi:hypothetical protein